MACFSNHSNSKGKTFVECEINKTCQDLQLNINYEPHVCENLSFPLIQTKQTYFMIGKTLTYRIYFHDASELSCKLKTHIIINEKGKELKSD